MFKIENIVKWLSFSIAFISFYQISSLLQNDINSIFWLLMIIACGIEYKNIKLNSNIILIIGIVSIGYIYYYFDNFLVYMILSFLFVKLLKEKKDITEYIEIFLISIVLFITTGFYIYFPTFAKFSIIIFILSVAFMIFLNYYLNSINLFMSKNDIKFLIKKILLFSFIGLISTYILFVIFPTSDNFTSRFSDIGQNAKVGFTNSVKLGDVSKIQDNMTQLLKIQMPKISSKYLYFRAGTLDYFDGRRWFKKHASIEFNTKVVGKDIKQNIYLNAKNNAYLFALDVPYKLDNSKFILRGTDDYTLELKSSINGYVNYKAISKLTNKIYSKLINPEDFLNVPSNLPNKIYQMSYNYFNSRDILSAIKNDFQKNYKYTTKNIPVSSNPLKDFITTKRGNCEYFVSLASVILRINDYPTRLVTGYRGGDYNEAGKFYVIKQNMAHTWIEVYFDDHWERFDPTPTLKKTKQTGIIYKAKEYMELLNLKFQQLVIKFELFKRQIALYTSKRNIKRQINKLIIWFYDSTHQVYFFTFLASLFMFSKFGKSPLEQNKICINKLLRALEKKGYSKKTPSQTYIEYFSTIEDTNLRKLSFTYFKLMQEYYYKKQIIPIDIKYELKDILKQISILKLKNKPKQKNIISLLFNKNKKDRQVCSIWKYIKTFILLIAVVCGMYIFILGELYYKYTQYLKYVSKMQWKQTYRILEDDIYYIKMISPNNYVIFDYIYRQMLELDIMLNRPLNQKIYYKLVHKYPNDPELKMLKIISNASLDKKYKSSIKYWQYKYGYKKHLYYKNFGKLRIWAKNIKNIQKSKEMIKIILFFERYSK